MEKVKVTHIGYTHDADSTKVNLSGTGRMDYIFNRRGVRVNGFASPERYGRNTTELSRALSKKGQLAFINFLWGSSNSSLENRRTDMLTLPNTQKVYTNVYGFDNLSRLLSDVIVNNIDWKEFALHHKYGITWEEYEDNGKTYDWDSFVLKYHKDLI